MNHDVLVAALGAGLGAITGACLGSYGATVLVRSLGESTPGPRFSRCDHCGVRLGPARLVPLLSYLLAGGRCAACGGAIDRWHPALELGGALVGATGVLLGPPGWAALLATLLLGWVLLLLAAFDLAAFWLPDRLTLPLLGAGLAYHGLTGGLTGLGLALLGAGAAFAALWIVGRVYRGLRGRDGLGGGDVKLFAAIGAWLGAGPLAVVLVLASGLGLVWGVLRLARSGRSAGAEPLPFGALLAAATWLVWLAHG